MKKAIFLIFILCAVEGFLSVSAYSQYNFFGRTDTVSHTFIDTLSRLDTNRTTPNNTIANNHSNYFWFSITTDSAMQFSPLPTFPLGLTWDIPAGTSFTSPMLPVALKNLYNRKKNNFSGNATYSLSAWEF